MGGVLDLKPLSLGFRQALVVGYLFNKTTDFGAKKAFQFLTGGLSIFDRVVKDGSLQRGEVGDTAHATENLRDFDGMIDVGARIAALAALVAMFVGCKMQGGEKSSQIGVGYWGGVQRLLSRKLSH